MVIGLTHKFRTVSAALPPMDTEEDVIPNAMTIYDFMKEWLRERNYGYAHAALDLLMRKKTFEPQQEGRGFRTRRDGQTPDFLHEMRIAMSVMADHYQGMIGEAHMESLLSIAFLHDLGEDFNITPTPLAKFLEKSVKSFYKEQGTSQNFYAPSPESLALAMERLTFDRKYSPADIIKELGFKKNIEITPYVLDLMADKIQSNSLTINGYLPKMRYFEEPDEKGRYVFSRYIKEGILDWKMYAVFFADDPHTGLIKSKDRGDGLGTRIGIYFDLNKYGAYLSKSFHIWGTEQIGLVMARNYPSLQDSFTGTDKMLGALHRIGRTYVELHPQRNPPGCKGFNIDTLSESIDFRDYFPGALKGYGLMLPGTNPLNIILSRIEREPSLNGRGPILRERLEKSIQHNIERNSQNSLFYANQLVLDL